MVSWMCGVSIKERKTSEELKNLIGVEPITNGIISDRVRCYGHVMRKNDEDCVQKRLRSELKAEDL